MIRYRIIQEGLDNPKFYVQYKNFLFWHYFTTSYPLFDLDYVEIENTYPSYALALDAIRKDIERRKKVERKIFNININDL